MSNPVQAPGDSPSRLFVEFFLMIALPLFAVFAGSTLALTAYIKGFSTLPQPPAATARPH